MDLFLLSLLRLELDLEPRPVKEEDPVEEDADEELEHEAKGDFLIITCFLG